MGNSICVFCGEKLGLFHETSIACGGTYQYVCRRCEKELKGLDELEICRRSLIRGFAENPERIQARIDLIMEAEDYRPKCLRCGEKVTFMKVQKLDNSPNMDSVFTDPFEVLPTYCTSCGKYEFYNPSIVRKNKHLVYLTAKDTQG